MADSTDSNTVLLSVAAVVTILLLVAGVLYFTEAGQSLTEWVAEKYFKAEAKAAEKALEKTGSEKAEGFLYVLPLPFQKCL